MKVPAGIFVFLLGLILVSCNGGNQNNIPQIKKASAPPPKNPELLVDLENPEVRQKHKLIQEYFQKMHAEGFNGNVLVAQDDKIYYKSSFGFSDFSRKAPLDLKSSFQVASVSKQFTAVAIMQLKEKGLLSYDDPIEKHIEGFPYKNITIRMLLSHRSGLPNYLYFCESICTDRCTPISNEDVVRLMVEKKPEAYYQAGKRFQYSNTNYCLLAYIVEKISGHKFNDYLQKNIFEQAGMGETSVYSLKDKPVIPNAVSGHFPNRRKTEYDYLNGVVGDKGIYSTVEDLYRWDHSLYSESILKQSTLAEAFSPANETKANGNNYGFGWRLKFLPDGTRLIYHGGWWQGFKSCYFRIPEDRTFIIVLSNIANHGFSLSNLFDVYSILKADFKNPNSSQRSLRDSVSF